MKFGTDFWRVVKIVLAVLKWLLNEYGDEEEKEATKNFMENDLKHL